MRKTFKKYFVPHHHNQYHPHLFRNASILIIFFGCTFLLGISYGNYVFLRQTVLGANIATNVLVDLANKNRIENNVPPLIRNAKLDTAATLKVMDMIENNYFAHYAPDGTTPWYFMEQAGYNFSYAGENLAINFDNEVAVDTAWMNSENHRANLLNTNFRDLGIASKEGMRDGVNTIFIVQMFGTTPKVPLPQNVVPVQKLKIIQEDKAFIAVKNIEQVDDGGAVAGAETYSSWYDRFVFDSPYYIQLFFIIVIIIISFGMCLRMIVEYKRQHYKHLIISLIFLLSVLALAALNLNFINFF